jgi:hypothetical protein
MAVGLGDLLLSSMQEIRADLREIRDEVGETKDSVGEIKLAVAKLESYAEVLDKRLLDLEEGQSYSRPRTPARTLARDGGLTVSGATLALVATAVLNHFWPSKPALNPAPVTPTTTQPAVYGSK